MALYVCSECGLRIGPADHDGPPDEPSRPCPACRPRPKPATPDDGE